MDVSEILRSAVRAVEEAGVPDDLRVPAFESAVVLLGGTSAAKPAPPTSFHAEPDPAVTGSQRATAEGGRSNDRLIKVATELGTSPESVDRLFDEHEGDLQFVGNLETFGKAKASKVQALAVLLVVARQAGGYDEGATADSVVRKEIDRHGLLDTGNYTKHIAPLKSFLNFNGAGRTLNFKPKYDGRQRAKSLALHALGE